MTLELKIKTLEKELEVVGKILEKKDAEIQAFRELLEQKNKQLNEYMIRNNKMMIEIDNLQEKMREKIYIES